MSFGAHRKLRYAFSTKFVHSPPISHLMFAMRSPPGSAISGTPTERSCGTWRRVSPIGRANARVMVQLLNFLLPASNEEPGRIGALTQTILQQGNVERSEGRDIFHEGIGTLVFHLWTRHGQTAALETIHGWLADRITFKAELRHGSFSIRGGLVVGYDNDNALEQETRARCQKLAFEVIDRSARGLEEYIALDRADQTDARNAEASDDAVLLDQMSDQFFFAIGAPEVRKGEEPRALGAIDYRRRYLADNEKTFRRVGDVGTPKTIHHMLQLLDFLAPGNPIMVFDLTSHALLQGGNLHVISINRWVPISL